jgi:hypothetical protein
VDDDQFDALVSRLSSHLTRRRSLMGMVGVAGAGAGAGLADRAESKKKKKKRKRKKKRKTTTTQAPGTQPPTTQPPTTRPGPTCTDGLKNGDESDVDCGGSCPRCANSRTCRRDDDCVSGFCSSGVCLPCTDDGQCGVAACFCSAQGICSDRAFRFVNTPSCNFCPAGTVSCEYYQDDAYNGVLCSPPCGHPFPE